MNQKKRISGKLLGKKATCCFIKSPEDKLDYIKMLQQQGEKVMMIGDGLNDAGALKQSDIGIAVTEDNNNFTPASDAIIEAKQFQGLHSLFSFAGPTSISLWPVLFYLLSIIS